MTYGEGLIYADALAGEEREYAALAEAQRILDYDVVELEEVWLEE